MSLDLAFIRIDPDQNDRIIVRLVTPGLSGQTKWVRGLAKLIQEITRMLLTTPVDPESSERFNPNEGSGLKSIVAPTMSTMTDTGEEVGGDLRIVRMRILNAIRRAAQQIKSNQLGRELTPTTLAEEREDRDELLDILEPISIRYNMSTATWEVICRVVTKSGLATQVDFSNLLEAEGD